MTDDVSMPPSQPGFTPNGGEAYTIGYGRPPKTTQFKKGQSGNPKGRPREPRNVSNEIRDVYTGAVSINVGGKAQKVSRISALHHKRWERGIKGNERATAGCIATAERLGLHCEPEPTEPRSGLDFSDAEFESFSPTTQQEIIEMLERRLAKERAKQK